MAKRLSAERALQLMLEEREASADYVEEEVSEFEYHISENSESESEFKEEDQVESHLIPKRRRAAHQQPALGPACLQLAQGKALQQPALGPEQAHKIASEEVWIIKNGEIKLSSCPRNEPPCRAANVTRKSGIS